MVTTCNEHTMSGNCHFLRRLLWKKSSSDKCTLCQNRQTTNHCLNICKVALDSGRFTWRHNNIINYIVQSLDTHKYTVHSDIPGHEAAGGGTVPPELAITPLKPDITIWDKECEKFHIFELTCPLEENIVARNTDKTTNMLISSRTFQMLKLLWQLLK